MTMSKTKFFAASALLVVSALSAQGANAQGSAFDGCTCVTQSPASSAVLGALSSPSGAVTYADLALRDGATVGTGADGRVSLTAGSCGFTLGSFKMAEVSLPAGPSGQVCVKISDLDVAGFDRLASSASGPSGQSLAIIAGAAAVGGVAIAVGAGGSSASK